MKPYITVHMICSLDGRIITDHWPAVEQAKLNIYEKVHDTLQADAWLVGRITMEHFAKGDPMPATADCSYPRTTWRADLSECKSYAIAIDSHGKLHVNRSDISGDAIIMILTEQVSDDHLAELQRDNISYIFAGKQQVDLQDAVELLNSEFGIKNLVVEGGGNTNGSFLSSNLVDEVSILIMPLIDGGLGLPTSFDRSIPSYTGLSLMSCDTMEGDIVHLRYKAN